MEKDDFFKMLTLLKDIACYCPKLIGKKDILLVHDKIYKITNPGEIPHNPLITQVIPCDGLLAFPGLIDQHVHIVGGGVWCTKECGE
ncbi:MAG: hypothetical protein H7Y41_01335 [Hyphomonadaceae bacterium]|nr:hypothetical protein [Clostridia bacterium]